MLPPRVRRAFRLAIRRANWTEADVDAELRLHVDLRVEQLVARGWERAEAEAEARGRFGPSWDAAVRQLHRSGHAREERLAMREQLDAISYDVRYALRSLRRARRFTAAAVLTLALGLGATTVIFSMVDHVVLRSLPYADASRLVVVREVIGEIAHVYPTIPANASHFLEWRRGCTACEELAAVKRLSVTLIGAGDPQRLGAARVSANLFALLGASPALGRAFREEEDQPGRDRVVMLSDAFWRRQFGADPSIIGRVITLGDVPYEVVGVLPPTFSLPTGDALGPLVGLPREIDLYKPLALTQREATTHGEFDYAVIARLRPGATATRTRAQLDAIASAIAQRAPNKMTLRSAVVPMQEQVIGAVRRPLLLLLCAVGAVLLIVCVNLANLVLARNAGRQRESAVRAALGAGRARLTRLALAESVVLAVAGGALGFLLARWGVRALVALAPATLPRIGEVRLDGRVFGVAALLTLVVGLAVGAVPAFRLSRVDPGETLKGGGRTVTGGRAARRRRALFIAAQVGLSTVLLVATGLFLTSFVRVMRVDQGFQPARVLALDLALPRAAYASAERRSQFYDRALREVAALPSVATAAVTNAVPLEGESQVDVLSLERDPRPDTERPTANIRYVSPGYFGAVGTPVRRGRPFSEADRGRPVVVLSERAARALWPGEDPIGKRVVPGSNDPAAEVVGIAADVRTTSLEQEGSVMAYIPFWQQSPPEASLLVRTTGDPGAFTTAARAALRRVDPTVPVAKVRTMTQVVSAAVAARRFQLALLALFGLMALVTASIGIYGVISQSLASRTGEMGVRMALGARPGDVHRLVLREGLTPVALGLGVGIAGSLAVGRAIESLLFEVRPGDPLTIAGVSALLAVVAVVACAIPARRATAAGLATMLRLE